MKKRLLLFASWVLNMFLPHAEAQNIPFTHSYGYFGAEEGYGIVETSDSGYVLCGQTGSFTNGQSDVFLVKIDVNGGLIWAKNIGFFNSEGARSIAKLPGGGFLIAGHSNSYGNGGYDVFLAGTDENGDTLFTKFYGGPDWDFAHKVIPLSDGNFLVIGQTFSFGSGGSDAYILKINAQGDTLFTRTFGTVGDQTARNGFEYQPGKVAICGQGNFFGNADTDVFLISLDHNANMFDFETIVNLPGPQEGNAVFKFPAGHFVVAGSSKPGSFHELASFFFNPSGSFADQTLLPAPGYDIFIYSARLYGSDEYLVAGKWAPSQISNASDAVFYRLNAAGFFLEGGLVSNSGENVANDMILSADGGVVCVGTSEGLGPGLSGILVWKLDSNLAGSVNPSPILNIPVAGSAHLPTVFPNPSKDVFFLFFPEHEDAVSFLMRDVQGRVQPIRYYRIQSGYWSVECAGAPSGWYLLDVYTRSGRVFNQKILISGE